MKEFNDRIPEKYFTLYMDKSHASDSKLNYVKALSQVQYSKNNAFMIEVDNTATYLINICQDRIFFAKSDMLSAMAEAQEFIAKHFKINISFSISSIHENIENIPIAYNESLYAMNYKNIMGIKKNIYYDDANNNTFKDTYYYPLSQEHQLLNYIKTGNYIMASEIIDGVFSKNLQAG